MVSQSRAALRGGLLRGFLLLFTHVSANAASRSQQHNWQTSVYEGINVPDGQGAWTSPKEHGAAPGTRLVAPGVVSTKHSGLQVVVRQALFDYGAAVSLDVLDRHIRSLALPDIVASVHAPIVGTVDVRVSDITCVSFQKPRAADTHLVINASDYELAAQGVSATFRFRLHWHAGIIQGTNDGEIALVNGDIAASFAVVDEGCVLLDLHESALRFGDIRVHIEGKLGFLYNAILTLFHEQVASALNHAMAAALRGEVPKTVNAYLADIPVQVLVRGLPFWAAFRYSVHTDDFVLLKAFPSVLDSLPRSDVHGALPASIQPPQPCATICQGRPCQERPPCLESSKAALRGLQAAAGAVQPKLRRIVASTASTVPRECPMHGKHLSVGHDAMLHDEHMVTGFLSDSIVKCVLWALFRQNRLSTTIQDGDIPGVRLITDLFTVLLPGISKDYPHAPISLHISATEMPNVTFTAEHGTRVAAAYRTRVFVQSAEDRSGGAVGQHRVEVADLSTAISFDAHVGFWRSKVRDLDVKYSVDASRYDVPTAKWEETVQYVVDQAEAVWGLRALYEQFISSKVTERLHLWNVATASLDGWYRVSTNVRLSDV